MEGFDDIRVGCPPWRLELMASSNRILYSRLVIFLPSDWPANTASTVTVVLLLPTSVSAVRQSGSILLACNVSIVHFTTGAPALLQTPFPLLLPGKDEDFIKFEGAEDDDGSVGGSGYAPGPGSGR